MLYISTCSSCDSEASSELIRLFGTQPDNRKKDKLESLEGRFYNEPYPPLIPDIIGNHVDPPFPFDRYAFLALNPTIGRRIIWKA